MRAREGAGDALPAPRDGAAAPRRARAADAQAGARAGRPWSASAPAGRWRTARAEAERESGRALAEAIELYTKALGYDAECVDAHRGLADLYWGRARHAEAERRPALQIYYEALVTEHDQGRYAALLRADARLSLSTNPPGAHVTVYRYVERDRVLAAADERYLGRTPVQRGAARSRAATSSSSRPRATATCATRCVLGRGAHHTGEVNLYTNEEIGEDFVYVPGGVAILGGDPDAYEPLPRQELDVAGLRHRALPGDDARVLRVPRRPGARAIRRSPTSAPRTTSAARSARTAAPRRERASGSRTR